MSTLDENAKEISEDAAGEATETPSPEMDIEEQDNGSSGLIILFFIIGLIASLIVGDRKSVV